LFFLSGCGEDNDCHNEQFLDFWNKESFFPLLEGVTIVADLLFEEFIGGIFSGDIFNAFKGLDKELQCFFGGVATMGIPDHKNAEECKI
jgi:hypothetical protein